MADARRCTRFATVGVVALAFALCTPRAGRASEPPTSTSTQPDPAQAPPPEAPPSETPPPPAGSGRAVPGALFTTAGVLLLGGGGALIGVGVTRESAAKDDIDRRRKKACEEGSPDCRPSVGSPGGELTEAEKAFVEEERSKGNALLGAGIAVSVLGVAGFGVGVWQLSKHHRAKQQQLTLVPAFGRERVGLSIGLTF